METYSKFLVDVNIPKDNAMLYVKVMAATKWHAIQLVYAKFSHVQADVANYSAVNMIFK
jgi:hypothetical protein